MPPLQPLTLGSKPPPHVQATTCNHDSFFCQGTQLASSMQLLTLKIMNRTWRIAAVTFCVSVFLLLLAFAGRHLGSSATAKALYRSASYASERVVEDYDFLHSPKESSCLVGVGALSSEPGQASEDDEIPSIVHFIYGLDAEGSQLPFMTYVAICAALQRINPQKIKLHHTYLDLQNEYLKKLIGRNVELVHHAHDSIIHLADGARNSKWGAAHLADLLRLDVLQAEGGIYLDSDVFALRSFDQIRKSSRDIVLGYEGGDRHGLCNAVILSRRDSSFLKRWRGTYSGYSSREWNDHSVILPKELASDYPDEICTLSPEVFFWPTWTHRHVSFMHAPLDDIEVAYVDHSLHMNNGSLWPDQLAYHAWSQLSRAHLRDLTPEVIRSTNTRFNIMMRPFLDNA